MGPPALARWRPDRLKWLRMSTSLLLGLFLFAEAVLADERSYTPLMACESIQALVASRGEVRLTIGPFLYGRYVRDGSFCVPGRGQAAQPEFVRSVDNPYCLLYTCNWRSHGKKD
jgi:hypothetical protein